MALGTSEAQFAAGATEQLGIHRRPIHSDAVKTKAKTPLCIS